MMQVRDSLLIVDSFFDYNWIFCESAELCELKQKIIQGIFYAYFRYITNSIHNLHKFFLLSIHGKKHTVVIMIAKDRTKKIRSVHSILECKFKLIGLPFVLSNILCFFGLCFIFSSL